MRTGASVRCLYPQGCSLTSAKTYQVLAADDDWIVVNDDTGVAGRYPAVRFVAVPVAVQVIGERHAPPPVGVPEGWPPLSILRAQPVAPTPPHPFITIRRHTN